MTDPVIGQLRQAGRNVEAYDGEKWFVEGENMSLKMYSLAAMQHLWRPEDMHGWRKKFYEAVVEWEDAR